MEDREPIYLWIIKEKAKTPLPFSATCRFPQNSIIIMPFG